MIPKELITNYIYRTKNSVHYSGKNRETQEHYITKAQLVKKLVDNEWSCMTECEFKFRNKKGRADIIAWCVDKNGKYLYQIIEVLHSETEDDFKLKRKYYPQAYNILLRKFKTNEDIDSFDV